MPSLFRRLAMLFRRGRFDQDLDDEMRLHQELRARDLTEQTGATPGQARAEARRRFGNQTALTETSREAWGWRWLEDLVKDLRYGLRSMRRSPGFTLTAILALALGIGANTAILSVVNGVLLRPLPYADPDRLVVLLHGGRFPVSALNYLDWKHRTSSFSAMGAAEAWSPNLSDVERPERVEALHLSADTLPLLGVAPMLGRVFTQGETGVCVLGYSAWQRRFGGDPGILGRRITLDGAGYTVVGVMPRTFQFAPFWATHAELWAPLDLSRRLDNRNGNSLRVFARLAPGAGVAAARADVAAVTGRMEQEFPGTNQDVQVVPLSEKVVGNVRPALLMLLGAVAFVLLVACANVAHMLLARAQARRREVVLRTALGAGRSRIVRQFLTESLLLAVLGGAAGILLGVWGVDLLVALHPTGIPRVGGVSVDGTVLGVMIVVTLVCGVGFGLVPALRATGEDLASALKDGGRGGTAGARRGRLRGVLVASQVALALPLLVGAGLMIRSFSALSAIDPGFSPRGVVSMVVSVAGTPDAAPGRRAVFYPQLLERVAALPGVTAASAVNHLPLAGDTWSFGIGFEGQPPARPGEEPIAAFRAVMPGYFGAMGIPILAGRDVAASDRLGGTQVVIINERLAKTHYAGRDPLGQRILLGNFEGQPEEWTIVGVVKDVRQGEWSRAPTPEIYMPLMQVGPYLNLPASHYAYVTLVARAGGDPAALVPAIRRVVHELDPGATVSQVATLDQVIGEATAQPRFYLVLLGCFAALALILAAVGIYGVMSYAVSQRTQELGIRMALGANRTEVLRLVIKQSLRLTLAGAAVGLVAAVALSRVMASLLYSVKPTDPLTLAAVTLVLGAVAALASFLPARRATRIDPMVALRRD